MVVPVVYVARALVNSPSQVTKTNMGTSKIQLDDEAIIAFKEHKDDSSVSSSMLEAYFEDAYISQVVAKLTRAKTPHP